jgi:hypothetical protein
VCSARVQGLTRALPNTRRVGPVAYDPESRSSVSVGSRPGKLPPAPLLRGINGVWPCSSRGHDPSTAGVDCGTWQSRSLRGARIPTSPCRSRERIARERVPSASGAESARPGSAAAPGRMVRTPLGPTCVVAACGNRTRRGSAFFHHQHRRLVGVGFERAPKGCTCQKHLPN